MCVNVLAHIRAKSKFYCASQTKQASNYNFAQRTKIRTYAGLFFLYILYIRKYIHAHTHIQDMGHGMRDDEMSDAFDDIESFLRKTIPEK
jgi:hypothetical protein